MTVVTTGSDQSLAKGLQSSLEAVRKTAVPGLQSSLEAVGKTAVPGLEEEYPTLGNTRERSAEARNKRNLVGPSNEGGESTKDIVADKTGLIVPTIKEERLEEEELGTRSRRKIGHPKNLVVPISGGEQQQMQRWQIRTADEERREIRKHEVCTTRSKELQSRARLKEDDNHFEEDNFSRSYTIFI